MTSSTVSSLLCLGVGLLLGLAMVIVMVLGGVGLNGFLTQRAVARRLRAERIRSEREEAERRIRSEREEAERKRREAYVARWGEDVADAVMTRRLILDMPEDALRLSLGPPANVDERVSKTKIIETWKYAEVGRNRYNLRVFVENGRVSGWDDKR